jgi:tetratricopeptide (TPR) repeat protein
MRRNGIALGLAVVLGVAPTRQDLAAQPSAAPLSPAAAEVQSLRLRAWELAYNLDHAEALAVVEHAIALEPNDPSAHRLAASILWMRILFGWGAVLVDDYLGQAREVVERPKPPVEIDRSFRIHIARALQLSEQRVQANARDPDAHFQLGASSGVMASYTATVEGRLLGSFGNARRAYREHQQALELDPGRKDAGMIPGMYRYSISKVSLPMRLAARLAGITPSRERGMKLVEEAAAYPSEAQAGAMFVSIVIYNREQQYDDALRVIRALQRRYPRNRLLWLESGTTELRAGRARVARAELEHGLTMLAEDPRPRAFGEVARWRLYHGMALLPLDRAEAGRELQASLMADAPNWVRGRTHKEMGKLADLAGHRADALVAYRTAARLCRAGHDDLCVDETNQLIRKPYR